MTGFMRKKLVVMLRKLQRERDELKIQLSLYRARHPRTFRPSVIAGGVALGVFSALYWSYKTEFDFIGRATVRSSRTLFTALRTSFDYRLSLSRWWHLDESSPAELANDSAYLEARRSCNIRAAQRLLKLFQKNGGIYIKLGQHLSALEYILPPEFCAIMSVLQNQAPKSSLEDVKSIIRQDLGCELEDVFVDFDPEPIGAASLAQVHTARLRDSGQPVAVKIQHLGIQSYAEVDMFVVSLAVQAVKYFFPQFEFDWLADEMRINLPRELDFLQEAHNSERVMWNFLQNAPRNRDILPILKIPKVMWKQTTSRVLTMEYCPGAKVTDLDYLHANGIDPYQVCNRLTKVFSEMIFLHGFVHCDPHPGNVFVRCLEPAGRRLFGLLRTPARWQLILLDHGLYREISTEFRLTYARLWMAVISGDVERIRKYCYEIGAGDAYRLFSSVLTHRTWNSVSDRAISAQTTLEEIQLIKERAPGYLVQVADFLAKIPRPLLLLLKTNDLLRAIERVLHEPTDKRPVQSFFITARFCADAVLLDELAHSRELLWPSIAAKLAHLFIVSKINLLEWIIRLKLMIFGKGEII